MRATGLVSSARGLGLHGHACWTYSGDDEFCAAAVDFLSDGLDLGQRLFYLGEGPPERLPEDLAGLPGRDELIAAGRLRLAPLEAFFEIDGRSDADALLAAWTAATAEALADGFTGARAVAQVTSIVANPLNWDAHARWEAVAERFMVDHPLAALCCYDRRLLPAALLRDLTAVHACSHAPAGLAPYRVYADPGGLTLSGEVDYFSAESLKRTLDRAAAAAPAGARLDVAGLEFVDHHGAVVLARHDGALSGHPVELLRTAALMGIDL